MSWRSSSALLALAALLFASPAVAGDRRSDPPEEEPLPCAEGASSLEALCACLATKTELLMLSDEREPECVPGATLAHGGGHLSVLRWGSEGTGTRIHLLIAHDGSVFRPVADLGRDFAPGAFGVHQDAKVVGTTGRTAASRAIVVVQSETMLEDFDMAGLALSTELRRLETVCALGGESRRTRCTQITVLARSTYGIGVELDPSEIDDDMRRVLAEIRSHRRDEQARLRYRIERDGRVLVTFAGGSRKLLARGALRTRRLVGID